MVNSSAAFGCSIRAMKNNYRAFHKFPLNNSELCKKWIVSIKRETFIPIEHSHICSDQFFTFRLQSKSFPVPPIISKQKAKRKLSVATSK